MRFALLIFLLCAPVTSSGQKAPEPAAPKPEDQTQTLRVNVKLVNVFATVTDQNGAPVTDLKRQDFTLEEDGIPQKIAVFDQESELPLSIVLAIDASQSVHQDFTLELESAREFAASVVRPVDALSVYRFSEEVDEVVPFTADVRRITRGLRGIRLGSATALYDAVYLSSKALLSRQGRKVIVVITDGGDTVSATDYHEAMRAAQIADAIVYSVIIVPIEASAGRNTGGEHALIQLSHETGGKYFYARSIAELNEDFRQISRELRTQYLLAYYPSQHASASDFHTIDVSVGPPPKPGSEQEPLFRVRHRTGYYSSKLE